MLSYYLTKEDYLETIKYTLSRKKKLRIASFCFTALCAAALVVWVVRKIGLSSTKGLLYCAVALALAGYSFYMTFFTEKQARTALDKMLASGTLRADVWMEHRLYWSGNELHCDYGELRLMVPGQLLEDFAETEGLYLVNYDKGTVFEAVPKQKVTPEQWQSFWRREG